MYAMNMILIDIAEWNERELDHDLESSHSSVGTLD